MMRFNVSYKSIFLNPGGIHSTSKLFLIMFLVAVVNGNTQTVATEYPLNPLTVEKQEFIFARDDYTSENELWYITVVDSDGTCLGECNSMILDYAQRPHITYADRIERKIKYARLVDNCWHIDVIDTFATWVDQTSLTFDSKGYPHVSYGGDWQLHYARWDGSSWVKTTIDSFTVQYWYYCGNCLALDKNDYPHIVYGTSDFCEIRYAKWDGSQWHIELVDSCVVNYVFNEFLELDDNDRPHISYYSINNVIYAYRDDSIWIKDTVFENLNYYTGPSMEFDKGNNPHLAFYDELAIIYAQRIDTSWYVEIVDEPTSAYGHCISIALDKRDTPHIAYWGDDYDLQYATKIGSSWYVDLVDSLPLECSGIEPYIIVDNRDIIHICYESGRFYVQGKLKYASNRFAPGQNERTDTQLDILVLSVYPNPFVGSTEVQYTHSMKGNMDIFKIFDVTGRILETTTSTTIGQNLKPGIYFLENQHSASIKIIKLK